MPRPSPSVLARLLESSEPEAREVAWGEFLTDYNRILLHVARSFRGDHDAAMDRYACMLEQLRADDFHRLRRYVADGRSEFTTWLVVVAQRICLDQHRHRYGRNRSGGGPGQGPGEDERVARRRLVDLLGAEVDLASMADGGTATPEEALRTGEIYGELENLLEQLGPHDRLLVKLRFEDDLTVQEIVRSLGFSTRFHVYRRLSCVLARLRGELQRKGITDPVP